MGKTKAEVEEMLNSQDFIELKLSDRKQSSKSNKDELRIYEF